MNNSVRTSLIVLAVLSLATFGDRAAEAMPNDTRIQQESSTAVQADAGPVAVPEPSDQAMRYYRSGNVLWLINVLWGLAIPALFLFTGFSARIRDWARAIGRKWFFIIAVYIVIFIAINFAINFPLDYYQGFVRQHAYDLSNQTFGKWLADALKSLMIGTILGVLFLWIPYLLIKRSPKRWWLYSGLAAVPFIFFLLLVSPLWIDPLFNDFGPMQDKQLETEILALAERAGIEGGRVYEVNKSVDTETVNAYVTGFLGSKRIVLWDTIIEKLDDEELIFVMGHEMGHYVLWHAIKGILFFSVLIMVALFLVHRTAARLIHRFRRQFKFEHLSDIASLPLLILLFNVFSLALQPVAFGFTRYMEHEADRFGLEITRDNHSAASAFVKLQAENLGNPRPGPLYKLWRATHPTLGERIDFCNSYRPWQTGEPLRYGDRFSGN